MILGIAELTALMDYLGGEGHEERKETQENGGLQESEVQAGKQGPLGREEFRD